MIGAGEITRKPYSEIGAAHGPSLPVEAPIVKAALTLLEAKQLIDAAFFLIQTNPRQSKHISDALADAIVKLCDASDAFSAYVQVSTCRGQA